MASPRLLLLEDDAGRAERIAASLSAVGIEAVRTDNLADAQEASTLHRFDLILICCKDDAPALARQLRPVTERFSPSAPIVLYGSHEGSDADTVLPSDLSESALGREIARLWEAAAVKQDNVASQLMLFDLLAFRQQMGEDPELINEIIGIFFEESRRQRKEIEEAIGTGDFGLASRIAHSLKGSLGSLHAPQARYWAQALEAACKNKDRERSQQCFTSLEEALSELHPVLKRVLNS
jgi:HPt (histidine-containing phosphotransfer) domain-containing protein